MSQQCNEHVPSSEPHQLQLIGAGLGRTGTTSLTLALTQLGFKTYHMDQSSKLGHGRLWAGVGDAELSGDPARMAAQRDRVAKMLEEEGFVATTDYPTCLLFDDHLTRYPNAKVILSVRSSPEAWATSVSSTIFRVLINSWRPPLRFIEPALVVMAKWFLSKHNLLADGNTLPTAMPSQAALTNAYSKWNAYVRATVPADRLLVHNAKDGWGPLCHFLGKECPEEPYPRSNTTADLKWKIDWLVSFTNNFWILGAIPGIAVGVGAKFAPILTSSIAVPATALGLRAGFAAHSSGFLAFAAVSATAAAALLGVGRSASALS